MDHPQAGGEAVPSVAETALSSSATHGGSRQQEGPSASDKSGNTAPGVFASFQPPSNRSSLPIRRKWNTSLPIHRLPPEIFHEILLFAQRDFDVPLWTSWLESKLRALAGVSRVWKTAILHNPIFWPILDYAYDEKSKTLILERNPSGPLMVRCGTRTADGSVQSFWEGIQHPQRVSSIVLHAEPRFSLPYAARFLPFTKELQIDIASFTPAVGEVELKGDIPIVRLKLDSASVPWNSPRLTSMRTLSLRDVRLLPSVSQLHTILSSSPCLEILAFDKFFFKGEARLSEEGLIGAADTQAQPHFATPIQLPFLRRLTLQRVPAPILDLVLSSVIAPECRFLVCSPLGPRHLTPVCLLKELAASCIRRLGSEERYMIGFFELEDQNGMAELSFSRLKDRSRGDRPSIPDYDYRVEGSETGISLEFHFNPGTESDAIIPWLSSMIGSVYAISFHGVGYEEEGGDELQPLPCSLHHEAFVQTLAETNWPIEHIGFHDGFPPGPILKARDGKSAFPFSQLSSISLFPGDLGEHAMESSFDLMASDVEPIVRKHNRLASRTHAISPIKTVYVPYIYPENIDVPDDVQIANLQDSPGTSDSISIYHRLA